MRRTLLSLESIRHFFYSHRYNLGVGWGTINWYSVYRKYLTLNIYLNAYLSRLWAHSDFLSSSALRCRLNLFTHISWGRAPCWIHETYPMWCYENLQACAKPPTKLLSYTKLESMYTICDRSVVTGRIRQSPQWSDSSSRELDARVTLYM